MPEGDTGTTLFTFTVTRTSGKGAARVNYAVTGAQAEDFTGGLLPSGTIFFRNGETSITLTIPVAGDTLIEPDETFTVTLSNPAGGTIATGTATGTIQNDDVATIQRVSVGTAGGQANGHSENPSISANGRYVAFESNASNLVAGDTNGTSDVFIFDLELGTTTRVSVDSAGGQANGQSFKPSISADGRYVAFESDASNLVAGDTNGTGDVFVFDLQLGTITRVSIDSTGGPGEPPKPRRLYLGRRALRGVPVLSQQPCCGRHEWIPRRFSVRSPALHDNPRQR
ncbi:hypothetical protein J2Z31_001754 [Sinorhizobium kostiense]|uniref:Calx-beta domain-containing protein n=1 Tax=Sinorhizobium kostiense TaxID=76747 RepID=A0ABS4R087_9HYPH|nr:Calx-beta domain-containing protein [Sinorhizobium kostiense]MBP2235262.1 hypothetical protein [Sinorhizobium kostiense]